jgi:hypothetical protein
MVAMLSRDLERRHDQACQLLDLNRDLTEEERAFVLDHWLASSASRKASDRAHFTPAGLAVDMSVNVTGTRIIDLGAGIGRLAFHCREPWQGHESPTFVCVERNPEYVRVGRKIMPEADWICTDILDLPDMRETLGMFDCALANPPYGSLPRRREGPGGYTGRRFEYHTIAVASVVARRGVFLIPQESAPFRCAGRPYFEPAAGDEEYRKFVAATGIQLDQGCVRDTSEYEGQWHDVCPRVEIVIADFTERAAQTACQSTGHAYRSRAAPETVSQLTVLADRRQTA